MERITKSFSEVTVLKNVSLNLASGEIVALMGENGAGKSTLMKVLAGIWANGTFDGAIFKNDRPVSFQNANDAHANGIAIIHQELAVFPELTVAEHLEISELPSIIDWDELFTRTQEFLDKIGFPLSSQTKVGSLSVGNRQLVEIAKALYRDAEIIVFDEPTSALGEKETEKLFEIILELKRQGKGILYISHKMAEIFAISDRIVVLRDGHLSGEFSLWKTPGGQRENRSEVEPRLIQSMVGRALHDIYPEKNRNLGPVVMTVKKMRVNAGSKSIVESASFSIRAGEIVGLGGLLGAGRSDVLLGLFGAYGEAGPFAFFAEEKVKVQTELEIDGKSFEFESPRDAIESGVMLVSEDRKGNGLVLDHSVEENLLLPLASRGNSTISDSTDSQVLEIIRKLRIKCHGGSQKVGELSGGNQQKVVIGKWLMLSPKVLLLDEPTRGIDVGAKFEIYTLMQELAGQGVAIVMVSSEMPELIGLSHRILVMRSKNIVAEIDAQAVTQEQIMQAASM